MNGPPLHPMANRRLAPRAALRRPATIALGSQALAGETCDISREGIGFISPRPISPGRRCDVTFALPIGDEERNITAAVKVSHSTYLARERFQIGAAFLDPADDLTTAVDGFLQRA